jgi:hypothetical protein
MTVPATWTCFDASTSKHGENIPFLPPIAASGFKIATWICEYCDSEYLEDFKRCGECHKRKQGKRNAFKKKDKQDPIATEDKEKKRG